MTDDEVADAASSAGALAAELGRLELVAIARLARHLAGLFLEEQQLGPGEAIHIATTTDDIRTLLESAIAQHDAADNSRGSVVAIGGASVDFDAVCWVLATRGHRIIHDGDRLPRLPDEDDPTGVLVSLPGPEVTDAEATLLRAIDETWTVPVIALFDGVGEDATFAAIVAHCDVLLPTTATADDVDAELTRAHAASAVQPSLLAHGRVPRQASDRLRSYGFRIRRASNLEALTRQLREEPAVVLFGVTATAHEVVTAAKVVQAMPAIRRTPMLWLGHHDDDQADLAHRHRIWPLEEITEGIAVRALSLMRAELAERAEADQETGTLLAWTAARVLTDRSLVAAHRSGTPVALAVITVDESVSGDRMDGFRDALAREFRRGDIIGRFEDRTTIVVLQGMNRQVATNRFAELLERLDLDHGTTRAGIAMFPNDGRSADELVGAGNAAITMSLQHHGPVATSTAWRPADEQAADVLVVEADDVLGRMLSSAIETRGLRAELVDNGAAALERLTKGDAPLPRALLLDMDVPGLDGLSLVRRLRRAGVLAQLNVLLMTARSSESDLRVAFDLGVSEIIRKPFSGSLLLHRLVRLLET